MGLGAVLVLVGVLLAAVSLVVGSPAVREGRGRYAAPLLAVAIILVGIGVLVGKTHIG